MQFFFLKWWFPSKQLGMWKLLVKERTKCKKGNQKKQGGGQGVTSCALNKTSHNLRLVKRSIVLVPNNFSHQEDWTAEGLPGPVGASQLKQMEGMRPKQWEGEWGLSGGLRTVLTASKNAATDLTWCKVELTAPHLVRDGVGGMTCVSLSV